MANAIIKKFPGISFPDGEKLFRDQIMDEGFVGHFDFKSQYVTKGYTGEVGQRDLNNLLDAADGILASRAFPLSGGYLHKDHQAPIDLPSAWALPEGLPGQQHFGHCTWFKRDLAFTEPANGAMGISGWSYQFGSENQYALSYIVDGGSNVVSLRANVNGGPAHTIDDVTVIAAFQAGGLIQFATEFEATSSGTYTHRTYLNGAKVLETVDLPYSGSLNQPSSGGTIPNLGRMGGFTSPQLGYYARTWLKDFGLGGVANSMAEIIAKEWELYSDRFA